MLRRRTVRAEANKTPGMLVSSRPARIVVAFCALLCLARYAGARPALGATATGPPSAASPGPAATPAPPGPEPSASPAPPPGSVRLHLEAHSTFISDGTSGPGTAPAEGPGFAAGSPVSPLTPYDTFSSAPLVPGNAAESELRLEPAYFGSAFDATLDAGLGYVRGSATNAEYWGEDLFPPLNPHLGQRAVALPIVFPQHPGADDVTGFRASILGGTIASKDGNVVGRAGYFDLAQSDGFVFEQPALTSVNPAVSLATPESLGDGTPNLSWWDASPESLPLDGVDLTAKQGLGQFEYSDAALPSLPGVGQRLNLASLVVDHGEGTRYSFDYLHLSTGGALVPTTILFGADGALNAGPQGNLPTSLIGGQRETIFGARGAFHVAAYFDAVAEYGHSTYSASSVAEPGSSRPGNYEHLGLSRDATTGSATHSASLDAYRNEPYYATAILPYGAAENVWAVAWSWPGQWLKSNYQLIDNYPVNVNREGYRVKYAFKQNEFDVRLSYANFGQIAPITLANAVRSGFVDGFFLPEADDAPTLGRQHQYALFAGFHPAFGDFTLDYTEDTMHRSADPGHSADLVSYDTPSYVLGYSRSMTSTVLVSGSYARYGMRGSFGAADTNVDFGERVYQVGTELSETPLTGTLLTVRRTLFAGIPPALADPPAAFAGTLFVVEQRVKL